MASLWRLLRVVRTANSRCRPQQCSARTAARGRGPKLREQRTENKEQNRRSWFVLCSSSFVLGIYGKSSYLRLLVVLRQSRSSSRTLFHRCTGAAAPRIEEILQ